MEDALYDTSWLVHNIPHVPPSLSLLFSPPPLTPQVLLEHHDRLCSHADSFIDSLSRDRPRYEREEEKEHLGGLRQCTWTRLIEPVDNVGGGVESSAGRKRKRDTRDDDEEGQSTGILINLVYEKKSYKFIIYTTTSHIQSSKRNHTTVASAHAPNETNTSRTQTRKPTALLLSKSSPTALKALKTYLSSTFSLSGIHPLQLPISLLQFSLEKYLSITSTHLLQPADHRAEQLPGQQERREKAFKSLIGTTKLTVSFSAPVAPSLKTLEIAIPPETVLEMCKKNLRHSPEKHASQLDAEIQKPKSFMNQLAAYVSAKTGLSLPLLSKGLESDNPALIPNDPRNQDSITTNSKSPQNDRGISQPVMRIIRVSTGAYALSTDSRLKFVLKAVENIPHDDENDDGGRDLDVVRRANRNLLSEVLDEARRQGVLEEG